MDLRLRSDLNGSTNWSTNGSTPFASTQIFVTKNTKKYTNWIEFADGMQEIEIR